MSTREVAEHLVTARQRGATAFWLGGGEPTLRSDAVTVVKMARRLGYERVLLQTNGMLLAYPEVAGRFADAGVTEVSFAIKGASAKTHDALTRTPGCHSAMVKGISEIARLGLPMAGDILLYADTVGELPLMVRTYAAMGLARFAVSSLSPAHQRAEDVSARVPRLSDVAVAVVTAINENADVGVTSLHTPPCVVPESHWAALFHAADLQLLIANPGGQGFMLEDSPLEGGTYLSRCETCRARPRCGGLRQDYLAQFGDGEFLLR